MKRNRFLEIIPGSLTWILLLTPLAVSFYNPVAVAVFAICFNLYWLFKTTVFGAHLIFGYLYLKRSSQIDWLKRCRDLKDIQGYGDFLQTQISFSQGWHKKILKKELQEILFWQKKSLDKQWEDILHVVILPVYKEDEAVLRPSINSYLAASYPKEKIIIILTAEERGGKEVEQMANLLKQEFAHKFFDFLITIHPDNIEGELKGKGANVDWALRRVLKPYLDEHRFSYDNVIVSIFDCDTRVHPQYFACVTYQYLVCPKRIQRSYQPIPLYSNNIWQVPILNRIVAFGNSFWQMIESTRPYRMVNFSSQALGFQTLVDIDFVDKTIVSEDSRHYYRGFFRYGGDFGVVPIFTPVYMDAVSGRTLWETLKNQYKQKRRWAWGIEHFPYLAEEVKKHKEISKWEKFVLLFRLLEGHISWSTASLLIAFVGVLPFLNVNFKSTVIGYDMPVLARFLLMLTWIGLFISALISWKLLPNSSFSFRKKISIFLQWIFVPITAIFFGSIPAVDAQTRLMLGKYLGFWVTPKISSKKEI